MLALGNLQIRIIGFAQETAAKNTERGVMGLLKV
jgi:hypothetical protein